MSLIFESMNKLFLTALILLAMTTNANAQVIGEVLNRPDSRPVTRQIPESSTIFGLLIVGAVFVSRYRKSSKHVED